MRKLFFLFILLSATWLSMAESHITIADPETWVVEEMTPYIGQTVTFDFPLVVSGVSGYLSVGPRRVFAPTNQVNPNNAEDYDNFLHINNARTMTLMGVPSGYHRTGERISQLRAHVKSKTQLEWISGTFYGNSREDLMNGPDMSIIDPNNERNLLVCGANLEYYLALQFDASSGMGPKNATEHVKQRTKVINALRTINADIYGLVEIQQGDSAMRELAIFLNQALPDRNYTHVRSGTTPSGTYTQSCYIYDANKVELQGSLVDAGTQSRKRMQIFREKSTGETFIYSINHFKAKSGTGAGADANGPQGQFNYTRTQEAKAVLERYSTFSQQADDQDILIMGDLNAYGMEDPIIELTSGGRMVDLHRYFHADTSYSYTFRGQAGYLDHALCSSSMLPQVTGMMAFHINSDEDDRYTYDKSSDATMFRCSDHDPVVVGLKLDKTAREIEINIQGHIFLPGQNIDIRNVMLYNTAAFYRIYTPTGTLISSGELDSNNSTITSPTDHGWYILVIYANGQVKPLKFFVH